MEVVNGKYKNQPCWECKNACGDCEWSAQLVPVPGWKAKRINVHGSMGDYCTYRIDSCPKFARDSFYMGLVRTKNATPKSEMELDEWINQGFVNADDRQVYIDRMIRVRERKRIENKINNDKKQRRMLEMLEGYRKEREKENGQHEQSDAEKAES